MNEDQAQERAKIIFAGVLWSFPSAHDSIYRPGTPIGYLEGVTHELGHILAAGIPLSRAKRQRAGMNYGGDLGFYVENHARGQRQEFEALAIETLVFEFAGLPLDYVELLVQASDHENYVSPVDIADRSIRGLMKEPRVIEHARLIARWYLGMERA